MHVAVFCGGKGSRLGVPVKCMVETAGRPWMDWKLDQLERCGASRVTLLVAHGADEFRTRYGNRVEFVADGGTEIPWGNVPDGAWWTYGDVLVEVPLWVPEEPTLVVTRNSPREPLNIGGKYLDAGLGFGLMPWMLHEVPVRTWQINTPESWGEADAYLRGYRVVG